MKKKTCEEWVFKAERSREALCGSLVVAERCVCRAGQARPAAGRCLTWAASATLAPVSPLCQEGRCRLPCARRGPSAAARGASCSAALW